jgi:ElaB/YqjD/DUF883 family membrane-anchored ribosome-binding protein
MKELLEDCLKAARERYSGAQRFAFLIAALFLAVHLTTVTQYLRREPAVRQASKNAETAKSLNEVTRQIAASTGKLAQEQADQTKAITETFVNELKKDFSEVDDAINRALRGLPQEAQDAQPQQQQVLAARKLVLPEDLAEKVRASGFVLKDVVDPWIEKSVIQPRLDELRDAWRTKVWPKLTAIAADLNSQVDEALKLSPKDPDLFELEKQLKAFVQSGASINFNPPANHSWWRTQRGKNATGEEFDASSASALHVDLIDNVAKAMQTAADKANSKADAIMANAEQAQKALEKSFEEQKKRAAELAQPIGFLAVDLAMLVETFPLILGGALGVAFFWIGWRRRELAQAWAALAKADAEWQHGAEAIGLAHGPRKELIVAFIAALSWVTFASCQLSVSTVLPLSRAAELGALGVCFLAVGAAWHWYENGRVDKIIRSTGS